MTLPIIGLDIGGTKLSAVLADGGGIMLHKSLRRTRAERGVEAVVNDLIEMVSDVCGMEGINPQDAAGLGVSFGGPVDSRRRVVYSPNMPGWDAVPLQTLLEQAFPSLRIVIDNDANAAALAEWRFGAGRGYANVLYMTMGTGIGGGVISDGRLVRGANDSAGEIGHICLAPEGPVCECGKRGCLQAFCSGPAIARRAQDKLRAGMAGGDLPSSVRSFLLNNANLPLDDLRAEHVLEAAKQGNAFALEHFRETAYYMGWGIANAVNLLNPEVVILGTVAMAAGELFFQPLREYVRLFAMNRSAEVVRIVPAELGEMVGDYAAVALILEKRS